MPYCENCGHKLSDGAIFCEECGTRVAAEVSFGGPSRNKDSLSSKDSLSTFAGDWHPQWLRASMSAGSCELGVIVTDVSALANQLSCSPAQLKSEISDYIENAMTRGVHYHLLDIGDNGILSNKPSSVLAIVDLLKQITTVACPKYLFILGNEEIIDVMSWENECKDSDEQVLADLPYVTLDTNSPWNGQQYNFSQVLHTGRLPSFSGETLSEFVKYFETASTYTSAPKTEPFGLSALVWQAASNAQYKEISKETTKTSPDITLETVKQVIPENANILYFNLHGSDKAKYWYGQKDCSYPEAFSPEAIAHVKGPYFLGVEACYGARYTQGLIANDSIVLTAMQNGCLALLGSSKIAYGPCVPPGTCADIIVGTFLKRSQEGLSAGDAYCAALSTLMSGKCPNDTTIKTLAEFSLYGDPSIRLINSNQNKSLSSFSKVYHISVPMPDVRRAVKNVLVEQDCKAVKAFLPKLQQFQLDTKAMFDISDYLEGTEPKYYKVGIGELHQAIYEKTFNNKKSILKIYFDGQGNIKEQLLSK